MVTINKIGLGGSCHWCTEAIFQSLIGVSKVEQGWISAATPDETPSEAVIVYFDPDIIDQTTLIKIHLHTHSCTSTHSMRRKYRSAVYCFSENQLQQAKGELSHLQQDFEEEVITQVLRFQSFRLNQEGYLNYYLKNPEKPFCQTYINPKLKILLERFTNYVIQ